MKLQFDKTKELIAHAANARWVRETSGLDVGDFRIDTTRDSQDMITKALSYLENAGEGAFVEFKALNGWITLDVEHVRDMGLVIGHHIQWCFGLERIAQARIASGEFQTTADLDAWFAQPEPSVTDGQAPA